MTVGLAAVCQSGTEDPRVVIAADRLVTTGAGGPIEHEHTSSKMVEILDSESLVSVGIGAGAVSLSDELFYKLKNLIGAAETTTTREIVEEGIEAYQELVRETIERQVLRPHGFTRDSFNASQGQLNQQVVSNIYQDMIQTQDNIFSNLNILMAGVDASGAHLYGLVQGDMARYDSIGYHAVGSGSPSANSAFIRNRYDDSCDVEDALFAVVEAKTRAEEAQGVGRELDIAVLSQDEIHEISDDKVKSLREAQDEIDEKQREARKSVLQEKDFILED